MTQQASKIYFVSAILLFSATVWAQDNLFNSTGQLPEEWYQLPEDRMLNAESLTQPKAPPASEEKLAALVDKIYSTDTQAMENVVLASDGSNPFVTDPEGYVPWHLEMFATDLAVILQGVLGIMTINGTPQVQAFWRRQGTK